MAYFILLGIVKRGQGGGEKLEDFFRSRFLRKFKQSQVQSLEFRQSKPYLTLTFMAKTVKLCHNKFDNPFHDISMKKIKTLGNFVEYFGGIRYKIS